MIHTHLSALRTFLSYVERRKIEENRLLHNAADYTSADSAELMTDNDMVMSGQSYEKGKAVSKLRTVKINGALMKQIALTVPCLKKKMYSVYGTQLHIREKKN